MKLKIEIKHWVTGSVLFSFEKEGNTIKDTVREANLRGANLRGANLRGANLYGADLRGADLRGADLREANLYGADLYGSDLYGADLREADLYGADLRGANLYGADLYGADLYGADLREADLYGADLRGANLYGADLYGADLRGANLYKLPVDYINQASRDMLFIMQCLKSELPYLKQSLIDGKVNGSSYEGDCACFVGTLANAKKTDVNQVCNIIPFYQKGTHNAGEDWFLKIKEGDTPENNQFAAHVMKLIEMVETGNYSTITYEEPKN